MLKIKNTYKQFTEEDDNYPNLKFDPAVYERITRQGKNPVCPFCQKSMYFSPNGQSGDYYCFNTHCNKKDFR